MAFTTSTSRTNNSTEWRNSRYVQGGETDRFQKRLGWWERRAIPRQDDDLRIVVGAEEAQRPDLIANRVYGKANLAWLVLQYNNIVDEKTELTISTELRLPTQRRVILDILTNPTGGVPVTP